MWSQFVIARKKKIIYVKDVIYNPKLKK